MQPTYNTPSTQANPWQLGPTASKIARWVFGLGFFSVHLGIFLIVGLTLLMINLYRSPDDLWVGGPLLRWGIVVVIHGLGAIVTWAITTAIDAAEATRQSTAAYAPPRPAPAGPPPAPVVPRIAESAAPPRPRFQPGVSTLVAATASNDRRSGAYSAAPVQAEPTIHRASPPGWSVVRPVEPVPAHASPAVTPAASTPPNWAVPATAIPAAPAKPDPTGADEDSGAVEDNRWTWVEAAAEAWLANRPEKASGKPDASKDSPS